MIDINVRGGKLGHGTEDKAAANEGDLDLHWVLAGTEAAKRSGLFIGHNNIVSVSVGALVAAAESGQNIQLRGQPLVRRDREVDVLESYWWQVEVRDRHCCFGRSIGNKSSSCPPGKRFVE